MFVMLIAVLPQTIKQNRYLDGILYYTCRHDTLTVHVCIVLEIRPEDSAKERCNHSPYLVSWCCSLSQPLVLLCRDDRCLSWALVVYTKPLECIMRRIHLITICSLLPVGVVTEKMLGAVEISECFSCLHYSLGHWLISLWPADFTHIAADFTHIPADFTHPEPRDIK